MEGFSFRGSRLEGFSFRGSRLEVLVWGYSFGCSRLEALVWRVFVKILDRQELHKHAKENVRRFLMLEYDINRFA